MVNFFLLINRFAGQIDAKLLENLHIHIGKQNRGVNFTALQLWKLFQRDLGIMVRGSTGR